MRITYLFSIFFILIIFHYPVFAQSEAIKKSGKEKQTISPETNKDSPEKINSKEQNPITQCFENYTEDEPIRFCLKVAYEKSERKRRFVQEKMFEVLIEQNFMSEGEQARIDKLKLRRDSLKKKNIETKNLEEKKKIARERIFDAENEKIILEFEQNNEKGRDRALEMMKISDLDFEKYRTSECERQKHFYSGTEQFSQFIYFSCLYKITEQRTQTLQDSIK